MTTALFFAIPVLYSCFFHKIKIEGSNFYKEGSIFYEPNLS